MVSNHEHGAAPLISVVVPVYFNAASLGELLRRLSAVARGLAAFEFEFGGAHASVYA